MNPDVEPPHRLLLYMRRNCHLCEDMVEQLEELQVTHRFSIEQRDVDKNLLWKKEYGDRVPVLVSGQTVICHYYLDRKSLLDVIEKSIPVQKKK
jgi:hypothetical protein|tara:strand:+ start:148 stop:429 length:282 start_codon:yes stop_codon:yes gene_type:complete